MKLQNIGTYTNQSIGSHDLLLCNTESGLTLTLDTSTDTVSLCYGIPLGYGTSSRGKLVISNGNTQLSVIKIDIASGNTTSNTLTNRLDISTKYDDLIDVTQDKNHIIAQKTKLTNASTGKTHTVTDVSKIYRLGVETNDYEYAYINDGKIALLNRELESEESEISSYELADTTHLLVGRN